MTSLQTSSHGRSDRGRVRAHNEDAYLDDADNRLWVVADGMGGHEAGDVASRAVVERLRTLVRPPLLADYVDRIDDALAAVNAELIDYARSHAVEIVGSTAALLVSGGSLMLCAWAGDSRVYQQAGGGLRQLTRDHSHGLEMLAAGACEASDLPAYAQAGALVRAIGAEANLVVEWTAADAAPHDVFLLCSDGVPKEMSESEIATVLARPAPARELADAIIDTCLARGARDNITAVVVRVDA